MHRLRHSAMRQGSELAWEGRLRSVKSSGFGTPITSLLDVQNGQKRHLRDSGEMGALRRALQQTCSMSMSRPSRTGVKLASWTVFVPRLWDHAGLLSPPRSSPPCARQSGGSRRNDALVMLVNL